MSKPKILIVDDEKPNRDIVLLALETMNCDFFEAENGQQAMEIFNAQRPDIVILDLRMPIMTGVEFLEHIEPRSNAGFQVVVMSGHGTEEEIEQCFAMGICVYVRKPFSIAEIIGAVNTAFNLNRLGNTLSTLEKIAESGLLGACEHIDQTMAGLKVDPISVKAVRTAIKDMRDTIGSVVDIVHSAGYSAPKPKEDLDPQKERELLAELAKLPTGKTGGE